jgi:hypothetical protein
MPETIFQDSGQQFGFRRKVVLNGSDRTTCLPRNFLHGGIRKPEVVNASHGGIQDLSPGFRITLGLGTFDLPGPGFSTRFWHQVVPGTYHERNIEKTIALRFF